MRQPLAASIKEMFAQIPEDVTKLKNVEESNGRNILFVTYKSE